METVILILPKILVIKINTLNGISSILVTQDKAVKLLLLLNGMMQNVKSYCGITLTII
jgi:hypothetical protein